MSELIRIEGDAKNKAKKRAAAYARVSTNKAKQEDSLEIQVEHYQSMFQNGDMELVKVYTDQGITATKSDIRSGFQELMKDCRNGLIDIVYTKSISRFSRNTVDCLEAVRELKQLGIAVIFEKENINTLQMEGEMMLSIMSSMAQDEAQSTSKNVKWGVKQHMMSGNYKLSYAPFGYDLIDGRYVVNKEQAETVKKIFELYDSGSGYAMIVRELNASGNKAKKGGRWNKSSVSGILHNPAYAGDLVLQKTYTDSTFKRHLNYGQCEMYAIDGVHEAIVDRDLFNRVSEKLRKSQEEYHTGGDSTRNQNKYTFTKKLKCGHCGTNFSRGIHKNKEGPFVVWTCQKHLRDLNACPVMTVREKSVQLAFVTMMNKLIYSKRSVFRTLYDAALKAKAGESNLNVREIKAMWSWLNKHKKTDVFEDDVFLRFVDHVVIHDNETYTFVLKCGLSLKERSDSLWLQGLTAIDSSKVR